MPYNSLIDRSDAGALIPEEASRDIIKGVADVSAVLRMARRLQDMSRKQYRVPVLSVLPTAYFVAPGAADENSPKQTSEVNWENVYINAEEIAVIVPIPESVLDDVDYDIWAEVQPTMAEAFGKTIDAAVYYGTNKPAAWPSALITLASAAGNTASLAAFTDLYDAILGETGVVSLLEADGFMPTGHLASLSMRGKLRGSRDANGQPIFNRTPGAKFQYDLDGAPCDFPRNGAFDAAQSLLISGDWANLVYSIRQDITYKLLTEAVVQDGAGNIVYNLAQQDMVALRAVMRLGWQLPNPANRIQPTKASRCQFSVLTA